MARSTNKQQAASQSVAQSLAHSSFHYPNTTPTCCIDKQINAIVAYHQLPAYKYYIRDHNKVNHYIFPCIIVNWPTVITKHRRAWLGPQHNCHENIFWSIIGLSCRHLSCSLRNSPFCPPLVLLSQIPPFLYDRNYFHRTTVVRPPSMISNSRNSIWSRPAPETTNGTHMVVTYNGRDIFLFIYCSSCNQWHMPVEGGHMGSHHEEFLNGDVCLPVSQMAW